MAESFLTLTNTVLARLNEVQLTSTTFSNARGIQVQCQNAVNEAVRFINQREFNYPFNNATETKTLTAGSYSYTVTASDAYGANSSSTANVTINAEPNEIILVAGKGHENYQLIGEKQIFFSDKLQAETILGELEIYKSELKGCIA